MNPEDLNYWHWWIFAAVLITLEMFAPGAFFLWLGIAAAIVGFAVFIAPALAWEYQLLLFSILSVFSIIIWRKYFRVRAIDTDQPNLNRRGEQYVGRAFTLEHAIVNGIGKIRVDDSTWKIEGQDCEAGSKIKVTGVEGTVLRVEKQV